MNFTNADLSLKTKKHYLKARRFFVGENVDRSPAEAILQAGALPFPLNTEN
jgi:hypothetical protein